MQKRVSPTLLWLAAILCVCSLAFLILLAATLAWTERPASAPPTLDLMATLLADENVTPTLTSTLTQATAAPTATFPPAGSEPSGKIAFTCQVYKSIAQEQICIMNADGSGWRRLTTENNIPHFYPAPAPDGKSVVYSAYRQDNDYEIYEISLDGSLTRLTDHLGILTAPEISPDGRQIVFTYSTPDTSATSIWVMQRDGSHPHAVFGPPNGSGWDPTWSPDGAKILFASDKDGSNQLYTIHLDGSGLTKITNLPKIRGRSDWSPDGQHIVTYAGGPWHRELYIMNADGSNLHQLSPSGGDSQGPSFSPDGRWVAFTAYFDHYGEDNGCEIYIIRIDGSDLRRLTNNDYCDFQPRWGP